MRKRSIKKIEILIKDREYQYHEYILNGNGWIKNGKVKSFRSIEECSIEMVKSENQALQNFYDIDVNQVPSIKRD